MFGLPWDFGYVYLAELLQGFGAPLPKNTEEIIRLLTPFRVTAHLDHDGGYCRGQKNPPRLVTTGRILNYGDRS